MIKMTYKIGANRNFNDTATINTVNVNNVTSTTVIAANPNRMALTISIQEGVKDRTMYVKLQAASIDNLHEGIVITREQQKLGSNDTYVMGTAIYTGEISVITFAGAFDIHVTEY